MKKLTVLTLVFLIIISISDTVTASEIFVQPGNSIQTAINSAVSGDTIIVKPGTYTENIKVTKDGITIRSESGNPDDTIINSRSPYANVFLLQADKVKINGLKISGSTRYGYSGICLSSCSYCTIENNKLQSDNFGIYLLKSKGNKIVQNNISDGYRGIYLSSSESNDLSGNSVTGNQEYGIVLQYSTSNALSGNLIFKNARGIYFGSSDSNSITDSIVKNNNIYGLYICGASDRNSIYNNYFNDTSMTIQNGVGNIYNITKTSGTNIVGGPYIGGNYWAKPDGTGFSQKAVDKNGDGISDSAYTRITGSRNSDYLPLVIGKPSDQVIPDANFWGFPRSGDVPLEVTFTDASTGKPTNWEWNFGDGNHSTLQNPVHTYSEAGNYTVTVIVSNAAGSDTMTKPSYLDITASTPSEKPNADFWGSPKSGDSPLDVTFTDASTGKPTSWEWNFGDGNYSTQQNPAHVYNTAGNYSITLTVSNKAGTSTKTKADYISVEKALQNPKANFWGSPKSGDTPLNVAFKDASTGAPTTWKWSFGDGKYSTEKNPAHTYSKSGTYTVALTVSNKAGSNTMTKPSYIKVETAPIKLAAAISAYPTSGKAPLKVQFTDKSAGSPGSWKWSFGDGTYSTQKSPAHTYSKAGKYTVSLTVKNSKSSNSTTKTGYIVVK